MYLLIVAIVFFIVGFFSGYGVRGFVDSIFNKDIAKQKERWTMISSKSSFRILITLVVSAVWLASVVVNIINPVQQISPLVHALMGMIVGFFFLTNRKDD